MQTEPGPGDSNEREQVNKEIVAALAALSDDPTKTAGQLQAHVPDQPGDGEVVIDGLSPEDMERFSRIAAERGITVEELFSQAIREHLAQETLSGLKDLWKEYFAGLRLMFRRSGAKDAAKDKDAGQ